MTLKQLSGLYYLAKKIAKYDEIILSCEETIPRLRARLDPGVMKSDGMPRSGTVENMLEVAIIEINTWERKLENAKRQKAYEVSRYETVKSEIDDMIRKADDPRIEAIMQYRFLELMSWDAVAIALGGGNSEDGVRKAFYRFLKKTHKTESCPDMSAKDVV